MINDEGVLDGFEVPWALQVVVHVEKEPAPQHTAVLRATASAVALALAAFTDPAAEEDVRARTERWRSGPIRKVVRRARGAGWTRQLAVPGVFTHTAHDVEVAVHVPGPVDEVDAEISRLQVGGLTLVDTQVDTLADPLADPGTLEDDQSGADVQLFLNPHVELTTGKAAAQVGHAAQLVLQAISTSAAASWLDAGAPVQVTTADEAAWDALLTSAPVVVADGGFTEVEPGTITVVATYSWNTDS